MVDKTDEAGAGLLVPQEEPVVPQEEEPVVPQEEEPVVPQEVVPQEEPVVPQEEPVVPEQPVPPTASFSPYMFTPKQWKQALGASTLPDLAAAVSDQLGFKYEQLRNGTSPWLRTNGPSLVAGYEPGKGIDNEQILGALTNARQYTPSYQSSQLAPMFDSAVETIPEAITGTAGFGYGFKGGYKAGGKRWWTKLPTGIVAGAVTSAVTTPVGREIGEALFGQKNLYLPKDQPMAAAGETFTFGLSGIPLLRLFPREAGNLAASRVLNQFNRVREAASPATPAASLEAKILAKEFGMTPQAFRNAARGKKPPVNIRFGATLERGAVASREALTGASIPRTVLFETVAAAGSSAGAWTATKIAPGEAIPRLLGEFSGAVAPGAAIKIGGALLFKGTPRAFTFAKNMFDPAYRKRMAEAGKGAFETRFGLSAANSGKVYRAFEAASKNIPDSPDLSNEQQFDLFIHQLGKQLVDEDGSPLDLGRLSELGPEEVLGRVQGATSSPLNTADRVRLDDAAKEILGLDSDASPEVIAEALKTASSEQRASLKEMGTISPAVRMSMEGNKSGAAIEMVQNALDALDGSFALSGEKAKQSYLKGAQAWINAARFEGSDEAMKDAAGIYAKIFTMDISRQINDQIAALTKATARVTGGELDENQVIKLTSNLFDSLVTIAEKGKKLEKQLWDDVVDMPIGGFFDSEGKRLDLPNVLTALDTPIDQGGARARSATAQDAIDTALGPAFRRDMERLRLYATGGPAIDQGRNVKATNVFIAAVEKSSGTRGLSRYDDFRAKMGITDEISEANIELLAKAEEDILRNSRYRSPAENKSHREAARLFKLERESLIAQKSRVGRPTPVPATADPVTYAELQEIRSTLLARLSEMKKNAGRRGRGPTIKALESVERALLDDVINNPEEANEAYNIARAYTFGRGRAFGEGLLGELYASVGERASTMDPVELIDLIRGSGGSGDVRSVRMIQRVADWLDSPMGENFGNGNERGILQSIMDSTVLPDATTDGKNLIDSLDAVTRNVILRDVDKKSAIDPATGEPIVYYVVNPARLAAFKKTPQAQELFEVFPDIANDLADAKTAQNSFDLIKGDLLKGPENDPVMKAMSNILGAESPEIAIGLALNDKEPVTSLNRMLTALTKAVYIGEDGSRVYPDAVKEGVRKAILNHASAKSRGTETTMNARVLYATLFDNIPKAGEKISLAKWMLSNDVITPEHLTALKRNLQQFMDVEDAAAEGDDALTKLLTTEVNAAKLMAVKIGGTLFSSVGYSRAMQKLKDLGIAPSRTMGGSLVVQAEGSEQAQNMLIRIPEAYRIKLQAEYMNDPKLLIRMLIEGRNASQNNNIFRAINTFLSQKGIRFGQQRAPYAIRQMNEEDEPLKTYTPQPSDDRSSVRPPAAPVRQVAAAQPAPRPPVPLAPAQTPVPQAVASAPAQPNPQQRQQYAALWPNDSASGMIRQQGGIGSLMG